MMHLKPFLTYEQQVVRLRDDHGLCVPDPDFALACLKQVNYYHLRGYYIHLLDRRTDRFRPGVAFEDIWGLYKSDRMMRKALYDPLASIEFRARCAIAYHLGKTYGPEGYRNPDNFQQTKLPYHSRFLDHLDEKLADLERRGEPFVIHHVQNYGGHFPIWAAVEAVSIGQLSSLANCMLPPDQKAVAQMLDLPAPGVMTNFLHVASFLRNTCAHHGRLFRKNLTLSCTVLRADDASIRTKAPGWRLSASSLFAAVLAVRAMISDDERITLGEDIGRVFAQNPAYQPAGVGFPQQWRAMIEARSAPLGSAQR